MAADLQALCADLMAETAVLDTLLRPLDEAGWRTPTPAEGWTVLDQIAHLAFFDDQARLAAADPDAFRATLADALAGNGSDGMVDRATRAHRDRSGDDVLAWFGRARHDLVEATLRLDPSTRVPWYGPDMTIASSTTARIMETWAHGIDVHDALGAPLVPTERLNHVAFLGVRAFANSFRARGLDVPDAAVRVELVAGDGSLWTYGPADATERVAGTMLDFCLLTVQRRHRADTSLVATGAIADQWLDIAQAFAGAPGKGRPASGGAR